MESNLVLTQIDSKFFVKLTKIEKTNYKHQIKGSKKIRTWIKDSFWNQKLNNIHCDNMHKNLLPTLCDVHMFRLMITFASCFTMGKTQRWRTFSKCETRVNNHIILGLVSFFGGISISYQITSYSYQIIITIDICVTCTHFWDYQIC
jgi:hypothetical protein